MVMLRLQVLSAVIVLVLTAQVGYALADGPSAGFGGEKVAQVSFIDRKLSLIHLSDGTELRAPDQHMLDGLAVGEWVRVDFVSDGARVVLNSIVPARPDEIPSSVPTSTPGNPSRFHG